MKRGKAGKARQMEDRGRQSAVKNQDRRQGRDKALGEGWNIGYGGGQGTRQELRPEGTVEGRTNRDQVRAYDKGR